MPPNNASYNNPVVAVFLRVLAWELYVAKRELRVKHVVSDQVQVARKELGLLPLHGGAPHDFIQRLRRLPNLLLTPNNTPPRPVEAFWSTEWRLLYLPPHNLVRRLSANPVSSSLEQNEQSYSEIIVTLRDPAVPTLRVFVGTNRPDGEVFLNRRGLYFIRGANDLYIGKTDEFDVRLRQHYANTNPSWWIFVSQEYSEQTFTQDALTASESLLISFWNEIACIRNGNRGADRKPAFVYLQQAVLFVEAASATLLWLIRERNDLGLPNWSIPFKVWAGHGWPNCYTKVPSE